MPHHKSDANVLFVAYEFPPRGGPGVQRSAKFAKYLPDFNYRPLVLTATEENVARLAKDTLIDETLLEDVQHTELFRCRGWERYLIHLPDKYNLRRLSKFFLSPDRNILAWVPFAHKRALKLAAKHSVDLIYTSVSPFSSAILGCNLKKALGVPWVVDFRDPWCDDSLCIWPTKWHYRFEERQEARVLEAADAIVVVTPTMKDFLVQRFPQWEDKVHVIPNGFDPPDFPTQVEPTPGPELHIGYTGVFVDHDRPPIGRKLGPFSKFWVDHILFRHAICDMSTHSPYFLLHAVRQLLDEHPEWESRIRLSFAGRFGEKNKELVHDLRLDNVISIKGYLPHKESTRLLMSSDVLFLPMKSHMNNNGEYRNYNYSGKVFEYLAARKPILAAVPEGDARDLIRDTRTGWSVDPRDIGAIKEILASLMEKKLSGKLNIDPDCELIHQFERRNLTKHLAGVFDSLLGRESA